MKKIKTFINLFNSIIHEYDLNGCLIIKCYYDNNIYELQYKINDTNMFIKLLNEIKNKCLEIEELINN